MLCFKCYLGPIVILLVAVVACIYCIRFYMKAEVKVLDKRSQAIAAIAAYTASGQLDKLSVALHAGLDNGLSINEIKEILVQQYAYAGFPRALNGINAFMKVLDERKLAGKKDKVGAMGVALAEETDKNAYGAQVQIELIGAPAKGAYQEFTPAIDAFLKEHLFADIFGRGVLSYQDRETATIAALSAIPGDEPQLGSHMRIGLNVGLTPAQISDIITVSESKNGAKVLAEVLKNYQQPQRAATSYSSEAIRVTRKADLQKTALPDTFFSGTANLEMFPETKELNLSAGLVHFEAGARTVWHTHPIGQMLIIADGVGRVQQEGGEIIKVYPGDVVWFPPYVKHWHGADVDQPMSHYALTGVQNGKNVEWLERVED